MLRSIVFGHMLPAPPCRVLTQARARGNSKALARAREMPRSRALARAKGQLPRRLGALARARGILQAVGAKA